MIKHNFWQLSKKGTLKQKSDNDFDHDDKTPTFSERSVDCCFRCDLEAVGSVSE